MSALIIENILNILPYGYVKEYKFDQFNNNRKWESDFALLEYGILIEYEGLNLAKSGKGFFNPKTKKFVYEKVKSRHQTAKGYTGDCEKYNNSSMLGYIQLRYTILSLKDTSIVIADIEKAIETRLKNLSEEVFCFKCGKQILIPKSLWLESDLGIKCLTCQWIEDDLKKKIKKSKTKTKKKL